MMRFLQKAFNVVSRQVVVDECATFFPELLPWVSWCYGSHPLLWHPLGQISSESGVQQGDPLGPLLFALVLQKLISSVDADDSSSLLHNPLPSHTLSPLEPPTAPSTRAAQPSASARKQCIVHSCPELIGPSMWHNHMTLHKVFQDQSRLNGYRSRILSFVLDAVL